MSSIFSRDPRVPHVSDSILKPGSFCIADARLVAWAFAFGAHRPTTDPPRPTRRSDLADVDFSMVVRVPRRSLWSRIAAAFRAKSSEDEASEHLVPKIPPLAELKPGPDNVIPFRRAA